MQPNLVITIINRPREKFLRTITKDLNIPFSFTMPGGGTVLHAKGTGAALAKKFLGVTLAEEKEIILIAVESKRRSADKTHEG